MSDTYNIGPTVPGLFAAHESRFKEAADEIDRLRATLERLLKYAWHKPGCEKCCVPIGYHSCTCGYDALMRKWRKNQILCVANPTTDQATASDAGGNEMNTGCLRCGRLPGNSHTEICALQGEIERLRHDIKRHIAIASELATEKAGAPPLQGLAYYACWDCFHKGPAVDCTGRTSEECRADRALNAEMKRLWNAQTPNVRAETPTPAQKEQR